MFKLICNVWLGVLLIGLASLLLLLSDLNRRQGRSSIARRQALPRLAVMQWASTGLLDNTVKGIAEGLRQQGIEDGRTASIRYFNASGDPSTGNMMARELVGGRYDMVLTASTLALQAVAAANREGRVMHVFGGVTDPYGSGVGITGPEPDQHPRHLVGVGTFQPVDSSFRIARLMNPNLKQIGVVWNPGEYNSGACVKVARAVCAELGLKLIEVNANNTSEVPEAIRSVLAHGVDAVWVGGDTVAIASINAIVTAARGDGIPIFSNDPTDANNGALFGLGASYEQVGEAVGTLGGKILQGAASCTFGVKNMAPEVLAVDEVLADSLLDWTLTDALRAQAAASQLTSSGSRTPVPARPFEIRIVRYNDAAFSEDTARGIMDSLAAAGWQEGREFNVRTLNAQGDMTTLSSILTAVVNDQPDLIMPISTPALQATLRQAGLLSIVFSSVGDGVRAGAGETVSNHMPNVTGITTKSPFEGMAKLIKKTVPGVTTVGTLFSPAEVNSELYRAWFEEALREVGIRLVSVPVNSSAETSESTVALLRMEPQVIAQISDNTTRPGYAQIVRRATDVDIPFFCFDSAGMRDGAALALARDFYHTGFEAGEVAVRVLQGESPQFIPFTNTRTEVMVINREVMDRFDLRLPAEYQAQCTVYKE